MRKIKEEVNKRFEEEMEKASSDAEIWKILNRERKRRKRINQNRYGKVEKVLSGVIKRGGKKN